MCLDAVRLDENRQFEAVLGETQIIEIQIDENRQFHAMLDEAHVWPLHQCADETQRRGRH